MACGPCTQELSLHWRVESRHARPSSLAQAATPGKACPGVRGVLTQGAVHSCRPGLPGSSCGPVEGLWVFRGEARPLPPSPLLGIKGTWLRLQDAPGHGGLCVGPGRMGPGRHYFRRDVNIIFDSNSSETTSNPRERGASPTGAPGGSGDAWPCSPPATGALH